MPALSVVKTGEATAPPSTHRSKAVWAKPMPKQRKNFIPAQNYLAYNWGTSDRDPDLDFICYAIEQSGMTLEQIEEASERMGHKVSRYCLMGWFFRGVRRPQNSTLSTVAAVIGWHRPWTQKP